LVNETTKCNAKVIYETDSFKCIKLFILIFFFFRLNSRVLNTDSKKNLKLNNKHESIFKSMHYTTYTKQSSINPITHWIVGDFSKLSTFKLIKNTFEHLVNKILNHYYPLI
jgi:hypothetical protein